VNEELLAEVRLATAEEGVPIPINPDVWTTFWLQFNAELLQKARVFLPEDGRWNEWTGQGENNNAATPWRVRGYSQAIVNVQHQRNGKWNNSLLKVKRRPMPSPDPTIRVCGEDTPVGDADWNDTIVFIVPSRE
jgi:hypothetical protein